MSFDRPLHGACHCGRNLYIVQVPKDAPSPKTVAQVIFNPHASHVSPLSHPLPTHLRVPLPWVHSLTLPLHPDESHSQIHRVYSTTTSPAHPAAPTPQPHDPRHHHHHHHAHRHHHHDHPHNGGGGEGAAAGAATTSMRHFCGFCGTPLSYWSEGPARDEGEYIQLSLGSLMPDDLEGLESWGVFGGPKEGAEKGEREKQEEEEEEEEDEKEVVVVVGKGGKRIPPAGGLGKGSVAGGMVVVGKLGGGGVGKWRGARWTGVGREGGVKVEWEVVEWTEEGEGEEEEDGGESLRKRKLGEVEAGR